MAKRNNVDMALKIARESRQILGAMGMGFPYDASYDEFGIGNYL